MNSKQTDQYEEVKYINWLYHVPGVGRRTLEVMLTNAKKCGMGTETICAMQECQLERFLVEKCGFTVKASSTIAGNMQGLRKKCDADRLWEEMERKGIRFILPHMSEYPKRLRSIPDPPAGLYVKGDGEFLSPEVQRKPVMAVIGARNCSEYGKYTARQLGEKCAQYGVSLVSGMALGVDGISQWSCLNAGGQVAAVLGCGADICYPQTNRSIYDELSRRGCICSEYIPGTEPKANCFPPRNRIISGMADVLVVVEAKEKSGTLITVDMALEQGKEVYVIPGRVTDPMSAGCNRLIRQGASIVCDMDALLEEIADDGLYKTKECGAVLSNDGDSTNDADGLSGVRKNLYPANSKKHSIFEVLDIEPASVQQIYEKLAQKCDIDISTLQRELLFMQMDGAVREIGGRYGLS